MGGGNTTGTTASVYNDKNGTNSLNGLTLTLNLTTTMSDSGGNATITTDGTLSVFNPDMDTEDLLYTYHITTTGSDNGGGFNPAMNPLTLQIGGGSANDGIISSAFGPAGITYTNVLVQAVPEPSPYALLGLGLIAAAFIAKRRTRCFAKL